MVRGAIKGLIISVPISIAVLVGMMALAMGDTQPWYVWLSLGVGMGVYAAGFLGTVGAVLVAGEKLDKINAERRGTTTGCVVSIASRHRSGR